jgi:hypothetical protein
MDSLGALAMNYFEPNGEGLLLLQGRKNNLCFLDLLDVQRWLANRAEFICEIALDSLRSQVRS